MIQRCGLLFLLLLVFGPTASAQNVIGYDVMQYPDLFLLREPAFQKDLGLSPSKLQKLIELNQSLDATLLGSRANKTPEESQEMTKEVTEKSRAALQEIFSNQHHMRLQQIKFRLKGLSFVLLPEAAKALELTESQQDTIRAAVTEASKKIKDVSSTEFQGKDVQAESQKVIVAARKEEQEALLAALDESQKQKLTELIGKPFDLQSLGQASFKAPELVDSGEWINSDGLRLEDLRGKVVALHFYAYG